MSNTMTAAEAREELQKSARLFRAFERIDQVLAVEAGIEQNQAERQQRLDALLVEISDADAKVQYAKVLAADTIAGANDGAAQIEIAAKKAADVIVSQAKDEAEKLIADAMRRVGDANTAVSKADSSLRGINAEIASKSSELSEIEEKLAAVRMERDRILRS